MSDDCKHPEISTNQYMERMRCVVCGTAWDKKRTALGSRWYLRPQQAAQAAQPAQDKESE